MESYCCLEEQHYAEGLTITKDCMTRCLDVEVDGGCKYIHCIYIFFEFNYLRISTLLV